MRLELRSIGYWSLIKVSFIVNLVVGFVIGLFFALFVGFIFSFAANMGGMSGMPLFQEGMPSIGILLFFYPFLFGFGGAIFNTIIYVIIAFVYNNAAKMVGGVEMEFGQVAVQPVAPPMYATPTFTPSQPLAPTPPPPPVRPMPPDMTPPPDEPGSQG